MKKTFGVVSRALLIGVTAALIGAPVALATEDGTGAGKDQQSAQCKAAKIDEVHKLEKRRISVVNAADAALKAANEAKDLKTATAAKADADTAKANAGQLAKDIQTYLDKHPEGETHDDRICAGQQIDPTNKAIDTAAEASKVAEKKVEKYTPVSKAEIFLVPDSLGRGEVIGVGVFCPKGKVGDFSSDAVEFIPESRFEEDNVVGIAGIVRKDATAGKHTVTSTCGDEKLTASFTVTAAPPVEAKKPTKADTRRKVVVKPKGKIETGGGATAVATV